MEACKCGPTQIVNIFLDRGVDCNKCDRSGQSALMIVYQRGYNDINSMVYQHSSQKIVLN